MIFCFNLELSKKSPDVWVCSVADGLAALIVCTSLLPLRHITNTYEGCILNRTVTCCGWHIIYNGSKVNACNKNTFYSLKYIWIKHGDDDWTISQTFVSFSFQPTLWLECWTGVLKMLDLYLSSESQLHQSSRSFSKQQTTCQPNSSRNIVRQAVQLNWSLWSDNTNTLWHVITMTTCDWLLASPVQREKQQKQSVIAGWIYLGLGFEVLGLERIIDLSIHSRLAVEGDGLARARMITMGTLD